LLEHPATSERLAWRLCEHFLGEGGDPAARKALAEGLRRRQLDIGWAVETVLRSRTFFAETSLRSHVLEPAAYVVGSVRALEIVPPPSTVALADWVGRLGQDLFYPPSVFGWAGGRGWITPRSSVRRTSFAAALVEGTDGRPLDALGLARRHGRGRDLDDLVGFYLELLLGTAPTPAWRERLLSGLGPRPTLDADTARRAVVFILSSPEAHVL